MSDLSAREGASPPPASGPPTASSEPPSEGGAFALGGTTNASEVVLGRLIQAVSIVLYQHLTEAVHAA